MNTDILDLCDVQARIFELSAFHGWSSKEFITNYMHSSIPLQVDRLGKEMKSKGEDYVMDKLAVILQPTTSGEVYFSETLFWIGYLFYFWPWHTPTSNTDILTIAPPELLKVCWLGYHTLSLEMAVDRLTEAYLARKGVSMEEKQALYSITQEDDARYYLAGRHSIKDILSAAKDEKPFQKLMYMGERISEAEYATIQQSDAFTFSVEIDFNSRTAMLYVVNNGEGGITEANRTSHNCKIWRIDIDKYNMEDL